MPPKNLPFLRGAQAMFPNETGAAQASKAQPIAPRMIRPDGPLDPVLRFLHLPNGPDQDAQAIGERMLQPPRQGDWAEFQRQRVDAFPTEPSEQDWRMHAAEGGTAYGAQNGMRVDQLRRAYDRVGSSLDQHDKAGRTALKLQTRKATPAPQRALIESMRPGTGPRPGSVGGAARTNKAWTEAAGHMGKTGRALGVLSLLLDAWDIAHARDKLRATAGAVGSNAGGVGGGILGAEAGGKLGLLGGPYAEITVPAGAIIGGLVGSTLGGNAGHDAGTKLYDKARNGKNQSK